MIYRFTKTFSYRMSADVEADSLEEAKELFESDMDIEWWEDDGGEHVLEDERYFCSEDGEDFEECE